MRGSGKVRVLVRRWYVLLPLLALTATLTHWVGQGVSPRYEVTATAVVQAGQLAYSGQHPYGSVPHTNQVLAVVLDAQETREELAARGFDPTYEVTARERRNYFQVELHSRTAQMGLETVAAVLEVARQAILQRQELAGTPEEYWYDVQVLQPPSISAAAPWRIRNMALVALLGVVISVMVTTSSWSGRRPY